MVALMGEPVTPMQILLFQRDPDCSPCRVADSPLGSLGHRYRALGICLLVAVLSGTAGCARSSAASDAPPLQLEEVGAYAVPDSFHVASVNVADDGTVALLSDQASHLLVGKVGEFKEFGAGILKKPVAVALDAEGNVKEVVDAELGSILKFEGERVVSRVPVKARMSISSALHAGNDGWYIAGADSVGTVYVGHAEPDGTLPLRRVAKLSGPARGSIFMTAAPSGSIILTRAGYPHRWATVASSGRPVVKELFDTTKYRAPGFFGHPIGIN